MKKLLAVLVTVAALLGAPAATAAADKFDCGAGTIWDPATNTCLVDPRPGGYVPGYYPYGYQGNYPAYSPGYVQFCFNGWWFSFCAGQ